ncbi:MAG: hypothetical protein MZV65_22560 [Chromatiales bacterium]|nr:hypothetical protein [Chromatiales bacterium]
MGDDPSGTQGRPLGAATSDPWSVPRSHLGPGSGEARTALALAGESENPGATVRAERQAKVEASRHTFAAVRDDFLLKYRGQGNRRPAPRTLGEMQRVLSSELFADWNDRPLVKIERRDVLDVLDVLLGRGVEVMANRTLAYLSMLFGWSVERGILTANPAAGIKKPGHEASRERVLSASELEIAIWHASAPTHTGDLFGPHRARADDHWPASRRGWRDALV